MEMTLDVYKTHTKAAAGPKKRPGNFDVIICEPRRLVDNSALSLALSRVPELFRHPKLIYFVDSVRNFFDIFFYFI